jgi:endoglucanase
MHLPWNSGRKAKDGPNDRTPKRSGKNRRIGRLARIGIAAGLVAAVAGGLGATAFRAPAALHLTSGSAPAGAIGAPLHTEGAKIVNKDGRTVTLTGVNWFGFETGTFAPHGLWARSYTSMLNQIVDSGFNTIRLPFSNEMFNPKSVPNGIDYKLNPGLKGLKGVALMTKIVDAATSRGLAVILDQHRPDQYGQSNLPVSGDLTEQQWINDWTMLARHFRNNPLVIGADLHNEPHGQATWGTGGPQTDWRLMAERAGNAILKVNPNWLIIVEGIDNYHGQGYWWGGDLQGAKAYPVKLAEPNHLVYSAHDYGPGVYNQNWFQAKDFPKNMPAIWSKHWAFLQEKGIAPVLLGEFGGRSVSAGTTEGKYQLALVAFLRQHGISYTYWSWNPDSGDTGGILNNNWQTVDKGKLHMLQTDQSPLPQAQKLGLKDTAQS